MQKKQGGIGWVLKDWKDKLLIAGYRIIKRLWKVSWLETATVCEGLHSIPTNSPDVIVNLDALQLVRLLNSQECDAIKIFNFISKAQKMVEGRRIVSFSHVGRRQNEVAHHLARKACQSDGSELWNNYFPNWLLELIIGDIRVDNHISGGSSLTGDISLVFSFVPNEVLYS